MAKGRVSYSDEDYIPQNYGFVGYRLFHSYCDSNPRVNALLSPYCVQLSFSLVIACAAGATANDLKTVFNFHHNNPDEVVAYHNKLMVQISDPDFSSEMVYVFDSNMQFTDDFYNFSKRFQNVEVSFFNFLRPTTVYRVITERFYKRASQSRKVRVSTSLKNQYTFFTESASQPEPVDLTPMLQEGTALILNAITFKAKIAPEFFKSDDEPEIFHSLRDRKFEVEMIRGCTVLRMYTSQPLKATICEVPLRNDNNFFLYVILPFSVNNYWQTVTALVDYNFNNCIDNFRPCLVDFAIPKVSMSCLISMRELLERHGLSRLFDKNLCELPAISSSRFALNQMYQMTTVEFVRGASDGREKEMDKKSTPNKFLANRPFVFIIRKNDTTGVVKNMFLGTFISKSQL